MSNLFKQASEHRNSAPRLPEINQKEAGQFFT